MAGAALVYTQAVIMVGGSDLSAELNELSVEQAAEMLDGTTFGVGTRVMTGGLLTANIGVGGLATFNANLAEDVLFGDVGADEHAGPLLAEGAHGALAVILGFVAVEAVHFVALFG